MPCAKPGENVSWLLKKCLDSYSFQNAATLATVNKLAWDCEAAEVNYKTIQNSKFGTARPQKLTKERYKIVNVGLQGRRREL